MVLRFAALLCTTWWSVFPFYFLDPKDIRNMPIWGNKLGKDLKPNKNVSRS